MEKEQTSSSQQIPKHHMFSTFRGKRSGPERIAKLKFLPKINNNEIQKNNNTNINQKKCILPSLINFGYLIPINEFDLPPLINHKIVE